jgi:hypothetical protein
MNDFEAKFQNFQNLIEIRVQSLFIEIDRIEEDLFEEINKIKQKILYNKSIEKRIKFSTDLEILEITENNLGTIYNEYDKLNTSSESEGCGIDLDELETSENDSNNDQNSTDTD